MTPPSRLAGFSLLELAIVLAVVALLGGGLLASLPLQRDLQDAATAETQLAEIRETLLGYAAANGHLPCPAKSGIDGNEDRTDGVCTAGKRSGLLPWVSLGTRRADPWSRLIRYSVTPAYASSATFFTLGTAGDITIAGRDGSGPLTNMTKPAETVAAVWSTGKNGHWGWQAGSAGQNGDAGVANDDEDTNSAPGAAGTLLVSRTPAPAGSGAGEFDDAVAWLPRSFLVNRMIAAGRLP